MNGEPLRVLHVAQPVSAGVPVAVVGYVRMLRQQGWHNVVACPQGGELGPAARLAGAEVVRWDATRAPGPSSFAEARRLAEVVRRVDPDVIHLHSSKAGLAGRLRQMSDAPVIFTPHAWSWQAGSGSIARAALQWERMAAPRTDAIVCCSDDEQSAGHSAGLRARGWLTVTNTIDPADLPDLDPERARQELELVRTRPLVACVARLSHQKGQDVLLKAWRRVAPDADLILVGDGPDRDTLVAAAPPGVTIVPPCSRDEALRWMIAADVVVAPSRYEGLSLSVLEAAAVGAVVVASDVGGMRQALEGTPGRLVPHDRPDALAAALAGVLGDLDRFQQEAQTAGVRVRERLANRTARNAAELDRLYRDLLGLPAELWAERSRAA